MSAHTPGPWFADKLQDRAAFNIFPHGSTLALLQVAGPVHDGAHQYAKDAAANARLIAAAPELLEALRAAYAALCISYPLHSVDMDKRGSVLAAARAAIAKVGGEA